jgi:hypothetical protein
MGARGRRSEAEVNGCDRALPLKARALARTLKAYEIRLKKVELRAKVRFSDGLR